MSVDIFAIRKPSTTMSVFFEIFSFLLFSSAHPGIHCVFPLDWTYDKMSPPSYHVKSRPYAAPSDQVTSKNYTKIREKAQVEPFVGSVTSYAGFINVNEQYGSNLFYWFFESEAEPQKDPLLLWLHGGPGHSSLYGLFEESGPYKVVGDKVVYRNTTWTKHYNVLYIDNPVGAGYSYTEDTDGYSRTVQQAAENLYTGLQEFFKIFPKFLQNPFYITGESYCGKYIPALATVIHRQNQKKKRKDKIKLKGLFIGCGFMDPANQFYFADYYYEMGILDPQERKYILDHEQKARDYMRTKNFYLVDYHLGVIGYKIRKKGYTVDVMEPNLDLSSYDDVEAFVQRPDIRKKIHVGDAKFQDKKKVVWYFRDDLWNSISPELSELLNNNYKVLFYGGQFDAVIPHTQIDHAVENLSWLGKQNLMGAKATNWYVDNELAGFKKSYKNVIKVMVRASNHIIVRSQQVWMLNLLRSFAT